MTTTTSYQEELARDNIKLLWREMSVWRRKTHLTHDEIHDAVTRGYVTAIQKFDPSKGYKFSTLFCICAKQKIMNAYRDRKMEKRAANLGALSLDWKQEGKDGVENDSYDHLAQPHIDDYSFFDRTILEDAMQGLKDIERKCIELYYYEQWSQQEIADALDFTQVHVSRLIRQGLAKMRKQMGVAV